MVGLRVLAWQLDVVVAEQVVLLGVWRHVVGCRHHAIAETFVRRAVLELGH